MEYDNQGQLVLYTDWYRNQTELRCEVCEHPFADHWQTFDSRHHGCDAGDGDCECAGFATSVAAIKE